MDHDPNNYCISDYAKFSWDLVVFLPTIAIQDLKMLFYYALINFYVSPQHLMQQKLTVTVRQH